MVTLDEIAKTIWRDTYRHDTLLEWHEIKQGTTHWKRVMAAAETVRYLLLQTPRADLKSGQERQNERTL